MLIHRKEFPWNKKSMGNLSHGPKALFAYKRNCVHTQPFPAAFHFTVLLPERFADFLLSPSAPAGGILQRAIQLQSLFFQTPESITPSVGVYASFLQPSIGTICSLFTQRYLL